MNNEISSGFIKQAAHTVGFDACGIARADALDVDTEFLRTWLEAGNNGEMSYLNRNLEKRTDPRILVPDCKTVVVFAINYYTPVKQAEGTPKIARYALPVNDYHTVIKTKLRELELLLCEEYGDEIVNQTCQHSFVDSAPVLERRWAERAGLGWIGKNTLLINPHFGSYVFLAELMLNVPVDTYDTPIPNRCGTCRQCMETCPTQAITEQGCDARKCISYLTIEKKGDIPDEFSSHLSGFALGCDICIDICPWNKKLAKPHQHPELEENKFIVQATPSQWETLEESVFNEKFHKSALNRAGFHKLKQNIIRVKKNK